MMNNQKKCIIIGGGFGGLGSAILMAKEGYDVTVYEKNDILGGRANLLEKDGFKRDMGPSRYLMPDVFETFFNHIGENISDYLDLVKLDPSYRIWFRDVPALPSKKWSMSFYDQDGRNMIMQGKKTIETRALNPEEPERYFGDINAGDTVELINKITGETAHIKISKKYFWKNFEELAQESNEVLRAIRPDQQGKDLHSVQALQPLWDFAPGYIEKAQRNGLVGFEFQIINKSQNNNLIINISPDKEKNIQTFESLEPGAGKKLEQYLEKAQEQYKIAMEQFVYKNYNHWRQFLSLNIFFKSLKLRIRDTMHRYVSRFFKSPQLQKIMEYTMLFLGTSPYQAPALFNIMSHVDFGLGVYYPKGGIHEIPKALVKIAKKYGVKFETGKEVKDIIVKKKKGLFGADQKATGVIVKSGNRTAEPNEQEVNEHLGSDIAKSYIDKETYFEHETNKTILNKYKTIEKDLSYMMLKHWSENKYLLLHYQKEGQDFGYDVPHTKDQVSELTGYTDLELIKKYTKELHFMNVDEESEINVLSKSTLVLYKLKSDRQITHTPIVGSMNVSWERCSEDDLKTHLNSFQLALLELQGFWGDNEMEKLKKNNIEIIPADIIISNADMRHTETQLLEPQYQSYPQSYRDKKVIAPSAFIMYLGIKGKLPQLTHHNLIFAKDWEEGYKQIFDAPQLPTDPSYYICKPSEVDPSVAPQGHENLFVLVPIAPGLAMDDAQKSDYKNFILRQIAKDCDIADFESRVVACELFTVKDFASKYNAFKGTALGLAHPLFQSAIRRPDNKSKKVEGLYYAGGYTNPGIGMPMCLISAMLVRDRIKEDRK